MTARSKSTKKKQEVLAASRGSLITLKNAVSTNSDLAVVVSNNIQNEVAQFLLIVPLERRISRLRAPFAVDLGRSDGLRELHCARCDWLTCVQAESVKTIVRAALGKETMARVDEALRAALDLR